MTRFDRNRRFGAPAVDGPYAPASQSLSSLLLPDTAALVRRYAASLQQLVSAEGVAVGYGSPFSMICVANSGSSAPEIGSELCNDPGVWEAIRRNRVFIFSLDLSVSQSCVAIPAPRESEISTLLMVYGLAVDTLGERGMRMLEAAAEYLAFIITAAAPALAELGLPGLVQDPGKFRSAPEGENSTSAADFTTQQGLTETDHDLPYFDAPAELDCAAHSLTETEIAGSKTLPDTPAWEQFDLLDDANDGAAKLPSSVVIPITASPSSEPPFPAQTSAQPFYARNLAPKHSKTAKLQVPIRALVACVLVVLLAGVLLMAHWKTRYVGAPLPGGSQASPSAPAELSTASPVATPVAIRLGTIRSRAKDRLRAEDLKAFRSKPPGDDASARLRLADGLAKSSDPALQREAYAWYIVAGEMGNSTAHKRARDLNSKIPKNKISEVRERIAAAFEEPSATRDLSKAYEWYLLAASSGAKVQPQLDRLRQEMTAEQVHLAEATAQDWLQRHRARPEH